MDSAEVTRKVGDELNLARISVPRQYLMAMPAVPNPDGSVRDWKVMLTVEGKEYLTLEGKVEVVNRKGQLRRLTVVPSDDRGDAIEEDPRDEAQRRRREARSTEAARQQQEAANRAQQRAAAAKKERKERTVKITYDINDYFFEKCKGPDGLQGAIEGIKERARSMLGAPRYERADISVHQGLVDGIYPDSVIVAYVTLAKEDATAKTEIPWKAMKYIFPGTERQLKAFMSAATIQELNIAKCCFHKAAQCHKHTAGRPCNNQPGKGSPARISAKRTREEAAEQEMHARQLSHEKEAFASMCANYVQGKVNPLCPTRARGRCMGRREGRRRACPLAVCHHRVPAGGQAWHAPRNRLRRAAHPLLLDEGRGVPPGCHVFLHGLRPSCVVGEGLLESEAHGGTRREKLLSRMANGEAAGGRHGTRGWVEGGERERPAHGLCMRGLRFLCFLVGCGERARTHRAGGWMCEQGVWGASPTGKVRRKAVAADAGSCGHVAPPGCAAAHSTGGPGAGARGREEAHSTRKSSIYAKWEDRLTKKQRDRRDNGAPLRAFYSYTGVPARALPAHLCPD